MSGLGQLEKAKIFTEELSFVLFKGHNIQSILFNWGMFKFEKTDGEFDVLYKLLHVILHEKFNIELTDQYLSLFKDHMHLKINLNILDARGSQMVRIMMERDYLFFGSNAKTMRSSSKLTGFRFAEELALHYKPMEIIKLHCIKGLGSAILNNCFGDMRQVMYMAFSKIIFDYYEDKNNEKYKVKKTAFIIEMCNMLTKHSQLLHDTIKERLAIQLTEKNKGARSFTFEYKNPNYFSVGNTPMPTAQINHWSFKMLQ